MKPLVIVKHEHDHKWDINFETAKIAKLELKKGDTLVVRITSNSAVGDLENIERARKRLESVIPEGVKVLIVHNVEFMVVSE